MDTQEKILNDNYFIKVLQEMEYLLDFLLHNTEEITIIKQRMIENIDVGNYGYHELHVKFQ